MSAREAPLIAGGAHDPNVRTLLQTFRARQIDFNTVVVGARPPVVVWDIGAPELHVDGRALAPRSVFIRHDVFAALTDPAPRVAFRSLAWTSAIVGWVLAHPSVRTPNREMWSRSSSKPAALLLAREVGLAVPATRVTNDRDAASTFLGASSKIAKPVAGGDLARRLDEAVAMASPSDGAFFAPAIIQEELVPPEVRVYVVGTDLFAFEVRSRHLDYRTSQDVEVVPISTPAAIARPLLELARTMGLDFCAADFKSTRDGDLRFLEVNAAPMFTRFDAVSGGAISNALVAWLGHP